VSISPRVIQRVYPMDTLLYTITYDATIIRNPEDPENVDYDVINLEIGKKATKLYSVNLHEADSVATDDIASGAPGVKRYVGFAQMEDIYTLLHQKKMLVFVREIMGGASLCYEEPIPEIEWEPVAGRKMILGYSCSLAKCNFRGRRYSAWYAPEIPLSYGPWKFHGLPGLILELEDDTGEYHYKATALHRAEPRTELVQWVVSARKVSKEKAVNALRYMFAHPAKFVEESYGLVFSYNGEMVVDSHYYAYNPIELE
jgi:GLPGLI family protein